MSNRLTARANESAEMFPALERALRNCGNHSARSGMLNRLRNIAHHGSGPMSPQDGPVVERLVEEQIITPDKASGRPHVFKLANSALGALLTQVNVDESGKLYIA